MLVLAQAETEVSSVSEKKQLGGLRTQQQTGAIPEAKTVINQGNYSPAENSSLVTIQQTPRT